MGGRLQARSLAEVANMSLQRRLKPLLGLWLVTPQHYLDAFNAALGAAQEQLLHAAAAVQSTAGWPPADCFLAGEAQSLPVSWWQAQVVQKQQDLLAELALPPIPPASDTAQGASSSC